MEGTVIEKRLLEALIPDLPGLERVERREGKFGQELVLVFVDGSQASVPVLGGIPARRGLRAPSAGRSSRPGGGRRRKSFLKKVERTVARIKESLGIPQDHHPIDVLAIASALGVKVYDAEFTAPGISLLVVTNRKRVPDWLSPGERATLFVSKEKDPLQKTFAIAHGLGHVVLGHVDEEAFRIDATGEKPPHDLEAEREANRFASALLVPEGPFRRAWQALAERGIHYVGALFGVSANVVLVRAQELGLEVPLP